jgi:hypothetical protein
MENKIGFFQEATGVKSSTRLNIFIILVNGLFLVDLLAAAGVYLFLISSGKDITLLAVVSAVGLLFTMVVTPCITWKQISKIQEKTAEDKLNGEN